jgi:hypothetical protein
MRRMVVGWVAALALALPVAFLPRVADATVTGTTTSVSYTGNGSTVAFTVPFRFLSSSDLVVTRTVAATTTTLVLNVDYTVSGAASVNGGTVTTTTAPASGATLTITRATAQTQSVSFSTQGSFQPATHEAAFDRAMMVSQDINRALNAAIDAFVPATGAATVIATGSTTARSLSDRFAEVFNVQDYGAKGDCSTVDTDAAQRAINAAQTAGSGKVKFPWTSGCYLLDGALTVQGDYITLESDGATLKWTSSYSGHGIEFKQTNAYPALRFHTGIKGFRLLPQAAAMSAVLYTLRAYGWTARDLIIDGPGTASATGTGILMDWGTDALNDYATFHRIENVRIIGYKVGIAAVDPHAERVTNTVVRDSVVYCEAQGTSKAIADLYDGSIIEGNDLEGCTIGVSLASSTGQGATIVANRFEGNPTADVSFGSAIYGSVASGNHHAAGSGGIVFANSTAQRNNYVWDQTLGISVQQPPLINAAARSSQTAEPVTRWYNYAESANPGLTLQLFGASGGTNVYGETVGTRELDFASGDYLLKFGSVGARDVSLYINSLPTFTFHRGTGENTVTTDANTIRWISAVADGGTAVAHALDTSVSLSTSGAKIASFRVATTEKAYVDKDGKVMGANLQAGTTGANTVTAGTYTAAGVLTVKGNVASNGTSIPIKLYNNTALTTSGDVIFCGYADNSGTTKQFCFDKDGVLVLPQAANTTGSPGAATANVAAGRSAFAAGTGAAGIVITNSLVTATSRVTCQIATNDATAKSCVAVPASGSFTAYTNANTTGITNFAWKVEQ